MKKTNQFKTLLLAALISVSSSVFAQVKIGTNPTAIESASNLEVEASTTGRKVKVDKTTGQLTINDGTQATGNVFTSDANGGGNWLPLPNGQISMIGSGGNSSIPVNNVYTKVTFPNTVLTLNRGGSFSNGIFTAPSAGIYYFGVILNFHQLTVSNQVGVYLFKNGAGYRQLYFNEAVPAATTISGGGSCVAYLNANETVEFRASTSNQPSGVAFQVNGSFDIMKLSN